MTHRRAISANRKISINGAVARLGREVGVPTPTNAIVASLIRAIQEQPAPPPTR